MTTDKDRPKNTSPTPPPPTGNAIYNQEKGDEVKKLRESKFAQDQNNERK